MKAYSGFKSLQAAITKTKKSAPAKRSGPVTKTHQGKTYRVESHTYNFRNRMGGRPKKNA